MMMKIVVCAICFLVFISACVGAYQTETENHVRKTAIGAEEGEAWCEMCVLVVDRMKVLIKEKDAEGKVNETLYQLCGLVQGYMKKQCYQMIPMIREQLTHEFDPETACKMMQLCGEDNVVPHIKGFLSKMDAKSNLWEDAGHIMKTTVIPLVEKQFKQFDKHYVKQAEFPFSCMICKTAVGLLDKNLQVYKQPLVDFVLGICNSLPGPTNKACSDAMSYYIPYWWDEFFKSIGSPEEVCYKLRLCDESYYLNHTV